MQGFEKFPPLEDDIEKKKKQAISWARQYKKYSARTMGELGKQAQREGRVFNRFPRSYTIEIKDGDYMVELSAYSDSKKLWHIQVFACLDGDAFEPIATFEKTKRTQGKWEESYLEPPEPPPLQASIRGSSHQPQYYHEKSDRIWWDNVPPGDDEA